jgi:hypothetical protein
MKILFLYFGQPRMFEHCLPWHDHLIKYLNTIGHKVDLEYHLWDKYADRLSFKDAFVRYTNQLVQVDDYFGEPDNFIKIDTDKTKDILCNNRVEGSKVKCIFYSYEEVENLWEICEDIAIKRNLSRSMFYTAFSQTISRAQACKNISNEYDMVFLLRTDVIFNPTLYDKTKTFSRILQQAEVLKTKNFIHVSWARYACSVGLLIDDKFMYSNPISFKMFYKNYKNKIFALVKNSCEFDPHYIAANLGLYCNKPPTLEETHSKKHLRGWHLHGLSIKQKTLNSEAYTLARPLPKVKELLKKITLDSFLSIMDNFKILK